MLQLCGGPGKGLEGCPNSFATSDPSNTKVFATPRFLDAVHVGAVKFMQGRRICSECHGILNRRGTTSSSEGGRFSLQPQCERTPRAYPPVLRPFLSVEKQRPENVSGFADIVGTSRLFCFVGVFFLKRTSIASRERQGGKQPSKEKKTRHNHRAGWQKAVPGRRTCFYLQ